MPIRDSDFFVVQMHTGEIKSLTLGRYKKEVRDLSMAPDPSVQPHVVNHDAPKYYGRINVMGPKLPPRPAFRPEPADDLFIMEQQALPPQYTVPGRFSGPDFVPEQISHARETKVCWVPVGIVTASLIGESYSPGQDIHGVRGRQMAPRMNDIFVIGRGSDVACKVTLRELFNYIYEGTDPSFTVSLADQNPTLLAVLDGKKILLDMPGQHMDGFTAFTVDLNFKAKDGTLSHFTWTDDPATHTGTITGVAAGASTTPATITPKLGLLVDSGTYTFDFSGVTVDKDFKIAEGGQLLAKVSGAIGTGPVDAPVVANGLLDLEPPVPSFDAVITAGPLGSTLLDPANPWTIAISNEHHVATGATWTLTVSDGTETDTIDPWTKGANWVPKDPLLSAVNAKTDVNLTFTITVTNGIYKTQGVHTEVVHIAFIDPGFTITLTNQPQDTLLDGKTFPITIDNEIATGGTVWTLEAKYGSGAWTPVPGYVKRGNFDPSVLGWTDDSQHDSANDASAQLSVRLKGCNGAMCLTREASVTRLLQPPVITSFDVADTDPTTYTKLVGRSFKVDLVTNKDHESTKTGSLTALSKDVLALGTATVLPKVTTWRSTGQESMAAEFVVSSDGKFIYQIAPTDTRVLPPGADPRTGWRRLNFGRNAHIATDVGVFDGKEYYVVADVANTFAGMVRTADGLTFDGPATVSGSTSLGNAYDFGASGQHRYGCVFKGQFLWAGSSGWHSVKVGDFAAGAVFSAKKQWDWKEWARTHSWTSSDGSQHVINAIDMHWASKGTWKTDGTTVCCLGWSGFIGGVSLAAFVTSTDLVNWTPHAHMPNIRMTSPLPDWRATDLVRGTAVDVRQAPPSAPAALKAVDYVRMDDAFRSHIFGWVELRANGCTTLTSATFGGEQLVDMQWDFYQNRWFAITETATGHAAWVNSTGSWSKLGDTVGLQVLTNSFTLSDVGGVYIYANLKPANVDVHNSGSVIGTGTINTGGENGMLSMSTDGINWKPLENTPPTTNMAFAASVDGEHLFATEFWDGAVPASWYTDTAYSKPHQFQLTITVPPGKAANALNREMKAGDTVNNLTQAGLAEVLYVTQDIAAPNKPFRLHCAVLSGAFSTGDQVEVRTTSGTKLYAVIAGTKITGWQTTDPGPQTIPFTEAPEDTWTATLAMESPGADQPTITNVEIATKVKLTNAAGNAEDDDLLLLDP